MSFRICSLFVLYVVASRVTLIDAAPFTHFFARDAGNLSTTGFRLQNGIKAQQLNAQFTTLTASDSCTAGSIACVNSAFAQCVGEKWVLTQCASGLSCFALPLVNSDGTSIACDTEQDAVSRISASGASGGLTGTGNGTNSTPSGTTPSNTGVTTPSTNGVNSPTSIISSSTSTPTTNPNDSGGDDDDCNDDPSESTSNGNSTATHSSDEGGDDDGCNDDPSESPSNGNSTVTDSSDKGGDDCDGDDPTGDSGPGGNSTNSTNTSTGSSGTHNVTSSSASASTNASPKSSQLYRRQFVTDAGAATFAVPTTQVAQTPSFSAGQTGTALSNLPSFTPTGSNPAASTVTFTLVSTVTMTISGCQGNPTNFPSVGSGTPGFSTAPPNTTPTAPFTVGTPASFTPTASTPPSNTLATPTSSPSSSASLGGGGISFSSQGGNNVDLEPTPTTMPQYATNGPSSTFNLSELLTATAY